MHVGNDSNINEERILRIYSSYQAYTYLFTFFTLAFTFKENPIRFLEAKDFPRVNFSSLLNMYHFLEYERGISCSKIFGICLYYKKEKKRNLNEFVIHGKDLPYGITIFYKKQTLKRNKIFQILYTIFIIY